MWTRKYIPGSLICMFFFLRYIKGSVMAGVFKGRK